MFFMQRKEETYGWPLLELRAETNEHFKNINLNSSQGGADLQPCHINHFFFWSDLSEDDENTWMIPCANTETDSIVIPDALSRFCWVLTYNGPLPLWWALQINRNLPLYKQVVISRATVFGVWVMNWMNQQVAKPWNMWEMLRMQNWFPAWFYTCRKRHVTPILTVKSHDFPALRACCFPPKSSTSRAVT